MLLAQKQCLEETKIPRKLLSAEMAGVVAMVHESQRLQSAKVDVIADEFHLSAFRVNRRSCIDAGCRYNQCKMRFAHS